MTDDLPPLLAYAARLEFDGKTFDADRDGARLNAQALRVWKLMADQGWRTLKEISAATGDPEASVSARLRDFRKSKYNLGVDVEREFIERGLWRYRVVKL